MNVFLRSASVLLAASIMGGCSETEHPLVDGGITTQPGFVVQPLLSDQTGVAANVNPALVNAWGLAMDSQSFWIAANGSGQVVMVAADGTPSKFPQPASALNVGAPITGIVANGTSGFMIGPTGNQAPAIMLLASESGQIFAINGAVAATPQMVIDRSAVGAVYKGLAIFTASDGTLRLAAADFHNNRIDVFDASFNQLATVIIVDPALKAGFAPFNLAVFGSNLFITYALQDAARHDDVPGVGNGRIDVFDLDGHFIRTLLDGGKLNAPWGMAVATGDFSGAVAGDLIVGNFGDGTLLAINASNGNNAQLLAPGGTPVVVDGLWGIMFGNGQNVGVTSALYFAAGPKGETHGLYGRILLSTSPST